MEIRDYTALINKCHLVEDYNRKLAVARSEAYKKKLALQGQKFKPEPLKKSFQGERFKGK